MYKHVRQLVEEALLARLQSASRLGSTKALLFGQVALLLTLECLALVCVYVLLLDDGLFAFGRVAHDSLVLSVNVLASRHLRFNRIVQ